MHPQLIQYRTSVDRADENQKLIESVFAELASVRPPGLRYAVLRAPDAVFYHLVTFDSETERSALTGSSSFRAFQAGIRERTADPPRSSEVILVGNYRLLTE